MRVKYIGKPTKFSSPCRKCAKDEGNRVGDTHTINGQTYEKGKTYAVDQQTGVYLIMTGLFREVA